MCFLTRAQQ